VQGYQTEGPNMTETTPPAPFVDDLDAPEIFTSGASGFFRYENNIIITFESPRIDHSMPPGSLSRVVVARLVLPLGGAQTLVTTLNDFLIQQGASPSDAIAGSALRQ